MRDELIQKLINSAEFKSQMIFTNENEIRKEYGDELYNSISKKFSDNWSYELTERLESIDIKALITDAVEKSIEELSKENRSD